MLTCSVYEFLMTLYMYICFKRCPRIRISMFLGARSINDAAVGAMACNRPDLGLHPQFQRAPRVRPGHYGVRGAGKGCGGGGRGVQGGVT